MVNYPGGVKKNLPKKETSYAKRGMMFEDMINKSCEFYRDTKRAVLHKKPTPITIVKVDYPERAHAKVTEAYFKTPSTTDYNGIYKGRYLDFEAKNTNNASSLPLHNFHEHQIEHMRACHEQGAVAFVLVAFSKFNRYFYLPFEGLAAFWDAAAKDEGRKSIPLSYFEASCPEIELDLYGRLKFLDIVDKEVKNG
ncbi:MAG: Holliday junction resolvase RecU [Lactobacillales bacterium]|jgi:recombination protein U|nr:Holliday junction resolvase RecU [Lactobacillales bacterium]